MIGFKVSNKAKTKLYTGITVTPLQTSMDITPGTRNLFPPDFPFRLLIEKKNGSIVLRAEIVEITANPSTDRFTMTRVVEPCPVSDTSTAQSSTPQVFDAGDFVSLILTAKMYEDIRDEVGGKLDKNGGLGFGYSPNKVFTTDPTGNMTTVDIATIIPSGSIIDTSFIAGETLLPREAVFVENMTTQNTPIYSYTYGNPFTSVHATSSTYGSSQISHFIGVRFSTNVNKYFTGATLHTSTNANNWRLVNGSNTVIANGGFGGLSFSTSPILLTAGVQYRLEVNNNTGSWSNGYNNTSGAVTSGAVTFQASSLNLGDWSTTQSQCIASIDTQDMVASIIAKNIGDATVNTRKTIGVFGSGVAGNTINLQIARTGTPLNLGVRIETDNAGNASGVLAHASAVASIAYTSIPTVPGSPVVPGSAVVTTVTFPGSFTLTKNTKYHLVFFQGTYGSETINPSNHYMISWDSLTSCQINKTWNGSTYTNQTGIKTYLDSTLFNPYLLRKSCGLTAFQAQCDGINVSSVSEGQNASFTKLGAHTTFTGLTERTKFYLSNTPGAISSSPGNVYVGVGTSSISTTLNVGMYKVT